jgi:hypothetical protein
VVLLLAAAPELEAHITNISGAAMIHRTISNRLENGRVICNRSVTHHRTGTVVKGLHLKMVHIEPIFVKKVNKVGFEAGNNRLAIQINT